MRLRKHLRSHMKTLRKHVRSVKSLPKQVRSVSGPNKLEKLKKIKSLRSMTNRFLSFNKELVFGELGAMIIAPLFSYIMSLFLSNRNIISLTTLFGGFVGGNLVWLYLRIRDSEGRHEYSFKHLLNDIEYFTPLAFLASITMYNPLVFFLTRYYLSLHWSILHSTLVAQGLAYLFFLVMVNVYRSVLIKYMKKLL